MPDDLKYFILLGEVKDIHRRVVALDKRIASLCASHGIEPSGGGKVRRDPGQWKGSTLVGRHFKECPVDYLEFLLVELLDFAKKISRTSTIKFRKTMERADLIRDWILFKKTVTICDVSSAPLALGPHKTTY